MAKAKKTAKKGKKVEKQQRYITVWTVGDKDQPGTPDEARDFENTLIKARESGDNLVVPHSVATVTVPVLDKDSDLVIVWRIGSRDVPASSRDIGDFSKKLVDAIENGKDYIVTHSQFCFGTITR